MVLGNDSSTPTLSVVDQDFISLGYKAAAMLDNLIQKGSASPVTRLVEPRRLIVRESSDVFHSSDPMVSEAMRYIADHCRETLQVDDLADALNTSRRTLERRFDELLGRSVYSEIKRLRTDLIKRLLIETDLSISALAHECGFGSTSHFTQFFTKNTGLTPSVYRNEHKGTNHLP